MLRIGAALCAGGSAWDFRPRSQMREWLRLQEGHPAAKSVPLAQVVVLKPLALADAGGLAQDVGGGVAARSVSAREVDMLVVPGLDEATEEDLAYLKLVLRGQIAWGAAPKPASRLFERRIFAREARSEARQPLLVVAPKRPAGHARMARLRALCAAEGLALLELADDTADSADSVHSAHSVYEEEAVVAEALQRRMVEVFLQRENRRAYEDGKREGRRQGQADGEARGYSRGYRRGFEEGRRRGRAEAQEAREGRVPS